MPKKRIPTKITFVLYPDYTDKKCNAPTHIREKMLLSIDKVLEMNNIETFDILSPGKKGFFKKMKNLNIPELWAHDILHDTPTCHPANYYVIEFDDNSRILCAMAPVDNLTPPPDPMFQ